MFIVQAITTRYIGPGNVRGARIVAKAAAGRVIMNYDHSLNTEGNHAKAAEALARKFNWIGHWFQGGMPDDSGYCFVCVSGKSGETLGFNARFVTRKTEG